MNTIAEDQKMVSGSFPDSRGYLETLTASTGEFISQSGHQETFRKTWAGAQMQTHLLK